MQTIVTHSGSFEPDDVLAVATVSLCLGKDNYQVIRSRDEKVIAGADWVLDVGGVYDVKTKRFDHHQNGVPKRDNGVPYSSFGLVWREMGKELCGSDTIADNIERRLVQPIDAADNQILVCDPGENGLVSFEFFDVINTFKPVWGSEEDFDTGFMRAVSFTRKLLKRMIAQGHGDDEMRTKIKGVYDATKDKQVLVFEESMARYIVADFSGVKVFVCPVVSVKSDNWMAVAVPKKEGVFKNRSVFPKEWSGLTGNDLETASGIKGAVFCHKELYIFVGKNKEAALQAAAKVIIC